MARIPAPTDTLNVSLRSQSITTSRLEERRKSELRLGSRHKKITCIPFDDFIARFVPDALEPRYLDAKAAQRKLRLATKHYAGRPDAPSSNPFKDMPQASIEKDMYKNITDALSKAGLTTRFQFVSTPYKGDSSERSGQAVDCGMYPNEGISHLGPVNDDGNRWANWSWVDIAIECKMNSTDDDPFDEARDTHEPVAIGQREVLGQVLDYIRLICQYQQRTFQFMVLFLGDMARILRIDRSGIFATRKFNYRDEVAGLKLAHFFWNYALLPASERGHDTTATRLDPSGPDAKRMQKQVTNVHPDDYVREMFAGTLDERWPWWKLEVPDQERGGSLTFLVGKPHFAAAGVFGRATRGYVALDANNPHGPPVYLKDAWRVVSDDIEKEGSVLKSLHEHSVQFIPTLICHGDLVGQETRTQAVWPVYHLDKECHLKTRQHYRLVVKEVGKPLDQFERSYQLVGALWCCVLAHAQAYEDANIIHQDISTGNMLLYRNEEGTWEGLLNDWELSKRHDQQDKKERQPNRTGTWQFMSALALNDHKKPIRIEDELESFLHVLLHISVRFLPHNLADEHVPQFLHDYFDDYSAAGTERHCGTAKFAAMQLGFVGISQYKNKAEDPRQLKFLLPADTDAGPSTTTDAAAGETTRSTIEHPINGIIEPLLSWLSAHYALDLLEQESLTRRVGSDVAPDFTNGFMRLMAKARRPHKAKDTKDSPSAAQLLAGASTGATAPDRVVLTERARKLGSHTATLELLEIVLFQSDWPPLPDRVGERNPAKSRVLKTNDQVPKASFILGSRKRNTPESVSKDPPSPPIKKSKA